MSHAAAPRGKPEFGIESVHIDGEDVQVNEEILLRKPFGQLKHFYREGVEGGPSLLIVAPMTAPTTSVISASLLKLRPADHKVSA